MGACTQNLKPAPFLDIKCGTLCTLTGRRGRPVLHDLATTEPGEEGKPRCFCLCRRRWQGKEPRALAPNYLEPVLLGGRLSAILCRVLTHFTNVRDEHGCLRGGLELIRKALNYKSLRRSTPRWRLVSDPQMNLLPFLLAVPSPKLAQQPTLVQIVHLLQRQLAGLAESGDPPLLFFHARSSKLVGHVPNHQVEPHLLVRRLGP
mmetsp:Transcript_12023/g.34757  ORF Transcript_12023/g.34757 Transcript_12023/m.34757 type:complete len:204 (+) Transcript_12023:141-752(+)